VVRSAAATRTRGLRRVRLTAPGAGGRASSHGEAIEDQVTNEVPGDNSAYSKPAGYSTVRYPLSGLVGDACEVAATEAHNAKYPDEQRNTAYLNGIVIDWLTAQPFTPSPSAPWNPQDRHPGLLALAPSRLQRRHGRERHRRLGPRLLLPPLFHRLFVIAAHAEIDGEKQLIGHEAVLARGPGGDPTAVPLRSPAQSWDRASSAPLTIALSFALAALRA